MNRPLLLHYHLFKNAGTSVEATLERNFGPNWVSFDSPTPAGSVFASDVERLLVEHPDMCALSSHQLKPPLPDIAGVDIVPIVFVRHPLDRIQSIYDFDRRRGPVTPAAELAAANDLAGYVRIMLDRDSTLTCNFQVRALSDAWDPVTGLRTNRDDGHSLVRAKSFVSELPAVGVVEHFEGSWRRITAAIRSLFPSFDPTSDHTNADPSRASDIDTRLERLRQRMGHELYDELAGVNAMDFELYRFALDRHMSPTEGVR
ncbi:MAG: hypothetical protein OEU32_18450 [Acidimicrobiia bacterium]|nr:hypothetical protein [Acidimicrobiia bacterium]